MRLTAKLVIAFVLVSVILMAVNGRLTMRREVKLREIQQRADLTVGEAFYTRWQSAKKVETQLKIP